MTVIDRVNACFKVCDGIAKAIAEGELEEALTRVAPLRVMTHQLEASIDGQLAFTAVLDSLDRGLSGGNMRAAGLALQTVRVMLAEEIPDHQAGSA